MTGIIFALLTMVAWTFGDFFIQKTCRKVGVVNSYFFLASFGAIVLLPFVWNDFNSVFLFRNDILLLIFGAFAMLFGGLFNFAALKAGKIAVVEPIASFELPLTILLGITIAGDILGLSDIFLMIAVFIGVILVATTHHWQLHYHKRWVEAGVLFAGLGAIGMALSNFIVGFSSHAVSPFFVVWFIHTLIAVTFLVYLLLTRQIKQTFSTLKKNFGVIFAQSIFDNSAWIFFGFASILLPISIAITISESYIAWAALLGIFLNKEKVKYHQAVGIVIVILGVLALSIAHG